MKKCAYLLYTIILLQILPTALVMSIHLHMMSGLTPMFRKHINPCYVVQCMNFFCILSCSYRTDQHYAIEAAANDNLTDARPVFDSLDWSEQSYRMFEHIGQTADHVHVCVLSTVEVCMHDLCHMCMHRE